MIEIAFLVDHPEAITTLTDWFRAQWPEHYAGRPLTDIARDFHSEANRDRLPIRLVAYSDGELVGTITLRDHAVWTLPEYSPGLGGLLVAAQQRGQGIGTELFSAGMEVAREQGYKKIYTTTVTAVGILERLGWKSVQVVRHNGEDLELFSYELEQ